MRTLTPLACLLAFCVFGLGGCGRRQEVKMVDPRTGVATYCYSDRFNQVSAPEAALPLQACLNELAYYGFRDEDWLRQAARSQQPPPLQQMQQMRQMQPVQPLPAPQPLPWLPAEGQRGPQPSMYAPPGYSGPVSPGN